MALLTLGDLELDGFAIPASVRFGGAQRLAVHKLIGGTRVIDATGRDDAALVWSGILSGAGASDRARTLDAMRVAGTALPLAWDVFCYMVVIGDLKLEYRNPWWIEYRLACIVLSDLAQSLPAYMPALADSIAGDLNAAAAFFDVSGAIAQISAPNALVPGVGGLTASTAAVAAAQQAIGQRIAQAGQGLNTADLASLVCTAGALARLSCASGYVGRTLANLVGAAA
jgi:hypothetical protein